MAPTELLSVAMSLSARAQRQHTRPCSTRVRSGWYSPLQLVSLPDGKDLARDVVVCHLVLALDLGCTELSLKRGNFLPESGLRAV